LTLDPTESDPPKAENFVTQPDPTRGCTRPVSNFDSAVQRSV